MLQKIYLHILILCGILCHGFTVKLLDEDDRKSADFLVRKRRVINRLPNEVNPLRIENANYIVNIKEFNRARCAGAILSHYTVITAAFCIRANLSQYQVLSGSGYEHSSNLHHVTSNVVYFGSPPHQEFDGIALVTIDPPFVYTRKTGFINLHVGNLPAATEVTVSGWGCFCPGEPGPRAQRRLRSITLPIIRLGECRSIYRNHYSITDRHICTYDAHKFCALTDAGAPLVYNNNLVGIHVWKGDFVGQRNPDVYIYLQNPEFSEWIREKTILM